MSTTEEQIKELWEWCGQYKRCGYCEETGRIYSSPETYSQCGACVGRGYFAPELDLNNLFKYAVPKLFYCSLQHSGNYTGGIDPYYAQASIKFGDNHAWSGDDPALALFWAIYSLIDKSLPL